MIKSKKDYKYYLEADRIALALPKRLSFTSRAKNILIPNHIWEFQRTLRKLEYHKNCKRDKLSFMYRFYLTRKFNMLSLKLGFSIPLNVFGPGLSIAHRGTIIVNGGARIGANCRLHACVNIGTEAGYADKAPVIGDNCYIGPGVKIYGKIFIANGTAIGANAVVNKSSNEENIAIAGIPAKKISVVDTLDFIIPATKLIENGYNERKDLHGLPARELKKKLDDYLNV